MTTIYLCYYNLVYLPVIYLCDLPEVYLWDLDVAIVPRLFLALQGKLIAYTQSFHNKKAFQQKV